MHERRGVDQLHRDGGLNEAIALRRWDARAQTNQQGPQPLAPGMDRLARVPRQRRPVTGGDSLHPPLDAVHQPLHGRSARLQHRLERAHLLTPTCKAMMPPAVSR